MEWLRNLINRIQDSWQSWKGGQKAILVSLVAVVILGTVFLFIFSTSPTSVAVFTRPITDVEMLDRISARLDQENVSYIISADNRLLVDDLPTARRLRALLAQENLIPVETDPWELFDVQRWTQTDFERNINLRRSITRQLEEHIIALEDIDAASVTIVMPEAQLFVEDQQPVTGSVIITPKPNSDIRENRKKIEGIEKLIMFAVEGLIAENLTITDKNGLILNDFQNLKDFDRLEITKRELDIKTKEEKKYANAIREALEGIYSADRVQLININVDMKLGLRTENTSELFPIVTVPDNPSTPFSEREYVLSIPRSTENVDERYEGTGFNPEGPPGMEGQTPPAYKDLEGIVGNWSNVEARINNEMNTRVIHEEKNLEINRITASIAIDGTWEWVYNNVGEVQLHPNASIQRNYFPVSADELLIARQLVQDAIGHDAERGDSVTVEHLQFDRTVQFAAEDDEFRRSQQTRVFVFYGIIAVSILILSFVLMRVITNIIERKRRMREEELTRQYQAMREASLRQEINEFERPSSLTDEIIDLARERPADVALLLRTWIMEE